MKKTLIALMALAGVVSAKTITGAQLDTNIDGVLSSIAYEKGDEFTLTYTVADCGYYDATSIITLASDWHIVVQQDQYVGLHTASGGPGYSYATRYDSTINTIDYDNDFVLDHGEGHPVTTTKKTGWVVDLGSNGADGMSLTITSSSTGTTIGMSKGTREITITSATILDLAAIDMANNIKINTTNATLSVGGTTYAIPEPATATLSLLALAGLCARRRRA